jgi:hypothetical protein
MATDTMDLEAELPRRERRRLVTPVGVVAGAAAIAALGFFGGVQAQQSRGSSAPAAGRVAGGFPGAAGGRPGAGGGAGAGGAAGAGQQQAGATVGQVSSLDGTTIYVDDSSGNTVKIRLGKGGKVTRTAVSGVRAIHPGDSVVVQGEAASSGTVVASSIRATASNADAGFGGGFGGAAPGATGAPGGGG